jgi:hypothetical protein
MNKKPVKPAARYWKGKGGRLSKRPGLEVKGRSEGGLTFFAVFKGDWVSILSDNQHAVSRERKSIVPLYSGIATVIVEMPISIAYITFLFPLHSAT